MGFQERLADGLYPGEGGLTGYTRARGSLGPTRRFLGLPRPPSNKPNIAGPQSLLLRYKRKGPLLSEILDRVSEDAVRAFAPHLLEERNERQEGTSSVSPEALSRAVAEEVKRQMPPFRLDGLGMKHRRPKG